MITQEMIQATMQERMADLTNIRVEQQAQWSRKKTANDLSRQSKPSWFRLPSLVIHALRPASAR